MSTDDRSGGRLHYLWDFASGELVTVQEVSRARKYAHFKKTTVFILCFQPEYPISNTDIKKIVKKFKDIDWIQAMSVEWDLQNICRDYLSTKKEHKLTLTAHKRRLAQIASSAKKLTNLLRLDDEDAARLYSNRTASKVNSSDAGDTEQVLGGSGNPLATDNATRRKWVEFREILECLSTEASLASRSRERMMSLRGSKRDGTRKSKERRYLWEPVFHIWVRASGKKTFSPGGPLMSILTEIHKALKIDPPSSESVRQAFDEFKKNDVPASATVDETEFSWLDSIKNFR